VPIHMYTLIETARLSDIEPEAWLANVIARIADHPITLTHVALF
jgi:transposase